MTKIRDVATLIMPQLIIKWGNRKTSFAVATPSVDIGRADDNLLQIKDVKVSRYQCKIVQTPLGFLLSDLDSSNGTFLNGKRVERELLHNNDILKIGNVEMVFSEGDSGQTENNAPVIISSGLSTADASSGEETTVINIQEESAIPAGKDEKPAQNGTAQVAVMAKVAKRIVSNPAPAALSTQRVMNPVRDDSPIGNRSNGNKVNGNTNTNASKMKSNISNGVNNQVLQDGSGKPSGTPAPQPQSRSGGIPKLASPAPRPASRIPTPPPKPPAPASRITPPPAPKSQTGLISRLNTAPKASKSSVSRISSVGLKAGKSGKKIAPADKQADLTQGPEQPKKSKNMLYIIGAAALILIVIIAFVASSGSNKKAEEDNKREVELLKKAEKLYDEKDYKEALGKYEAFLEEFKDSKYANDVKEKIDKIKERDQKEKEARPKLVELKRKKKEYSTSKYPELLKEFDEFIKDYGDISPAIVQEAKGERDTVKRIVSSSGENEVNVAFNKALGEANTLRNKKDYDGAIDKLKSFLKENRSLNDRQENAIKTEIKAIEKEKAEKSEKK